MLSILVVVEFFGQDGIGSSSQCDELMGFSVLGSDVILS